MSQPIQFQEAAAVFKRLLKERAITYKDLAKKLSLSESSVKKLFISNDCSFQRMSEICSILGITLADLMTNLQEAPIRKHRYTPKQEKFLVENTEAFHLYCKIVFEDMSVAEIKNKFNISDSALFKILRSLDKHDLIQLMPDGEVKYQDMGMVLLENAGPLVEKMKREWPAKLLSSVQGNDLKPGHRLILRNYRMKESTLAEFIRALANLEFEFARRSYREEKLERSQTVQVSSLSVVAPRSFIEKL